ncbi:MAG: hypothetical protein ACRAUZ_02035 [Aeromonas jandaei]
MELPSGGYLSRDAVAARPELMLTPGHPFFAMLLPVAMTGIAPPR